jgi:MtN3 and saliva related transmembrane protein
MTPGATDVLGIVAGALTTAAFFPQVLKTWRTRSTTDISLGMFLIFGLGLILWMGYGAVIGSAPIVVANTITLVFVATILYFKLRYK